MFSVADALSKLEKDSIGTYGWEVLYCVRLPCYSYDNLVEREQEVKYIHGRDFYTLTGNWFGAGFSGVHGPS